MQSARSHQLIEISIKIKIPTVKSQLQAYPVVFKNVVRFDGSGGGVVGFFVEGVCVLGTAVVVVIVVESSVVEACVEVVALVVVLSVTFDVPSPATSDESVRNIITRLQSMFLIEINVVFAEIFEDHCEFNFHVSGRNCR